jgi:HAMP domain-containing protein
MAIPTIFKILERQTLNTKLLLVLGFVYLITATVGIQSIFTTQTLKNSTQKSYEIDLLGVSHIQKAQLNLSGIGRYLRQMAMTSNSAEREVARKALQTSELEIKSELIEVQKRLMLPAEQAKLAVFKKLFLDFSRSVEQIVILLNNGELFSDGEAIDLIVSPAFNATLSATEDALSDISNFKQEDVKKSNDINAEKADAIQRFTIVVLAFGFLGSVGMGALISNSIRKPFKDLSESVENLAQGQLDIVIPHAEYQNEVGNMAKSLKILQDIAQTLDEERWCKKLEADLFSQFQQANDLADLSRIFFLMVCPLLKIPHALLYVNQNNMLQWVEGYGQTNLDMLKRNFKFGDGLIGQCALEKKPIMIAASSNDYIKIHLGCGVFNPTHIFILPVLHANELKGVLEFAYFESLGNRELKLLDALLHILATSIHIFQRTPEFETHLTDGADYV